MEVWAQRTSVGTNFHADLPTNTHTARRLDRNAARNLGGKHVADRLAPHLGLRTMRGDTSLRRHRVNSPVKPGNGLSTIATMTILVIAAGFAFAVRADEASSAISAAPPASSIQYRQVFVPADKMEAWPRDGEKLIPIETRDFDDWIRSANAASGQINQVAISTAEYSA